MKTDECLTKSTEEVLLEIMVKVRDQMIIPPGSDDPDGQIKVDVHNKALQRAHDIIEAAKKPLMEERFSRAGVKYE
jgi:hypothetical protein